jgi:undecaprenyl-diphosphatase
MLKDRIVRFDTVVTRFVQRWPRWLKTPMLVITNTGQPAVMTMLAVAAGMIAWRNDDKTTTLAFAIGLAAMGANSILKHYVHRTRPDTLYVSNMYFKSSSFPSGHSFSATVVCGLLIVSLAHLAAGMAFAAVGLMMIALAVGISRVYVGAHFPTDVIAGWLLGSATVWLIVVGLGL